MPINSLTSGSATIAAFSSAMDMIDAASLTSDRWLHRSNKPASPAWALAGPNVEVSGATSGACEAVEPEWLARLNASANRIAALKAGWDGPGSIPIFPKALFLATSHARLALENLHDVSAPYLVPGGDGSAQIEWHSRHGDLELDIDARGGMYIWIRDHRNGAEFDAENDAALALFYRWAPWVASQQHYDSDVATQAQVLDFAIAA